MEGSQGWSQLCKGTVGGARICDSSLRLHNEAIVCPSLLAIPPSPSLLFGGSFVYFSWVPLHRGSPGALMSPVDAWPLRNERSAAFPVASLGLVEPKKPSEEHLILGLSPSTTISLHNWHGPLGTLEGFRCVSLSEVSHSQAWGKCAQTKENKLCGLRFSAVMKY